MNTPHITCIQMTSTGDLVANLKQAHELMQSAVKSQPQLMILPEMFALMSANEKDKLNLAEKLGEGIIQDFLINTARELGVWIVGGTIPIIASTPNKVHAACLVYDDKGNLVARYNKIHLFDAYLANSEEVYVESKYVLPGDDVIVIPTPFGRLGLAVCYDLRFPEFFRQMQELNVEVIAVPTAFTYETGRIHWEIITRARAIENLVYVATACQTGMNNANRQTYGHSTIINPWGEKLSSIATEVGVVSCPIDLAYQAQLRQEFPVLKHRRF